MELFMSASQRRILTGGCYRRCIEATCIEPLCSELDTFTQRYFGLVAQFAARFGDTMLVVGAEHQSTELSGWRFALNATQLPQIFGDSGTDVDGQVGQM